MVWLCVPAGLKGKVLVRYQSAEDVPQVKKGGL